MISKPLSRLFVVGVLSLLALSTGTSAQTAAPADRAQDDHPHARVRVHGLEHKANLFALTHLNHVERRPVENDVGALAATIDFDPEPVQVREPRIGKHARLVHPVIPRPALLIRCSRQYV